MTATLYRAEPGRAPKCMWRIESPTPSHVISAVCHGLDIPLADLLGRRYSGELEQARIFAALLLEELCGFRQADISEWLCCHRHTAARLLRCRVSIAHSIQAVVLDACLQPAARRQVA